MWLRVKEKRGNSKSQNDRANGFLLSLQREKSLLSFTASIENLLITDWT